jgi:hypothetical protein
MNLRKVLRTVFALVATLLLSASANAQIFRAYLALTGNDANPCTLPQPCRLLPAALAAVANGGEIWMLDSANYNTAPVDVAKSVTILAVPGAVGSVVATGGNAIDIATAGVNVTLRNLVIVPLPGGGGVFGINMSSGASLVVDNCLVANLPNNGINVTAPAKVRIIGSTIRRSGATGVWVQGAASSTTTADIAESTIDGNALQGVVAISSNATAVVKASVRDSRIVQTNGIGVIAESDAGASVTLSVSNNIVSNNAGVGIESVGAGGKVWASGNTVSGNSTGLFNTGGAIFESAGNNSVRNNGADTSGTISTVATM